MDIDAEMVRLMRWRAELLQIFERGDDEALAAWLRSKRGVASEKTPPRFGAPRPRRAAQTMIYRRRGLGIRR
jgi:hypothetical protein